MPNRSGGLEIIDSLLTTSPERGFSFFKTLFTLIKVVPARLLYLLHLLLKLIDEVLDKMLLHKAANLNISIGQALESLRSKSPISLAFSKRQRDLKDANQPRSRTKAWD